MIRIGDRVVTHTLPDTSHYKAVIGNVSYIRNGFVGIDTEQVMDKWSHEYVAHECSVATAERFVETYTTPRFGNAVL